jgi:hypothetical protein
VHFTLIVDDFGIKYIGEEHTPHLKIALELGIRLHTHQQVGRQVLHWNHLGLGLKKYGVKK